MSVTECGGMCLAMASCVLGQMWGLWRACLGRAEGQAALLAVPWDYESMLLRLRLMR